MPAWEELLKFAAGVAAALASVWGARLVRGGSLAETLRKEQTEIRRWLNDELDKTRRDHMDCARRLASLENKMHDVTILLKMAVERRASGLPHDLEMAAAMAKLEQQV